MIYILCVFVSYPKQSELSAARTNECTGLISYLRVFIVKFGPFRFFAFVKCIF